MTRHSRRDVAALSLAFGASALGSGSLKAQSQIAKPLIRRTIPQGKGETIPVIGVGTSEVFDVGSNKADQAGPTQVVQELILKGGRLIDTAPSYGNAEKVVGDILTATGLDRARSSQQSSRNIGPAMRRTKHISL